MGTSHADLTARWRAAVWIIVIVGASIGFSKAFACATPFVALATIAAMQMERRPALLAVGLAWLANQAIGFLFLGYPHGWDTFVWGGAIGLAAFVGFGLARLGSRLALPATRTGFAFGLAFVGYESTLLAIALAMQSGTSAFSVSIVGRLFAINLVALLGLLALHRIATSVGLTARQRRSMSQAATA